MNNKIKNFSDVQKNDIVYLIDFLNISNVCFYKLIVHNIKILKEKVVFQFTNEEIGYSAVLISKKKLNENFYILNDALGEFTMCQYYTDYNIFKKELLKYKNDSNTLSKIEKEFKPINLKIENILNELDE